MIDLAKIQYRFVIMDEKGNQYNIKDYVENLGWEEGKKELSTRISFTTKNEQSSKKMFSSIAKLGCLVGIFASDGAQINEEVARGYIVDWKPTYSVSEYKFDGKCYDSLYNLQESQNSVYFSAGMSTKTIITKTFDDWEIPLGEYQGPEETHGKLAYKAKNVSDIIMETLDDAYKKGATRCIVQERKGKAYVLPYANNKTVYHISVDNTSTVSHKRSTAGMITRVKVIGQEDDDGKSAVEAVLNGSTQYGVRQKIVTRGTDDSLDDAKTSAQTILDEDGEIQEEITIKTPDIPFIHKGDLVHVTVGTLDAYYYVLGISHDAESRSMTMDLCIPYKEYEKKAQQTVEKKKYNVGDVVYFKGGTHYVNSYPDGQGYNATAGWAKITIKDGVGGAHPWHLIHVDNESNVYGWVDDGTFE